MIPDETRRSCLVSAIWKSLWLTGFVQPVFFAISDPVVTIVLAGAIVGIGVLLMLYHCFQINSPQFHLFYVINRTKMQC